MQKYNDTQSHLYIFVYGDPLDSALSVSSVVKKQGIDWFYKHQKHLKGNGSYENIYKKDVLNYENIMHSWMRAKERNIICIDYCDLWDKDDALSVFLGFNVKLPEKVERSKKEDVEVSQELFSNLRKQKEHLKSIYRSPL